MIRRQRQSTGRGGVLLVALLFIVSLQGATAAQDKKLKLEEVIARHLDAIGSGEARAAAKARTVSGATALTMRLGGAGNLSGNGALASSGARLRLSMKFPAMEYTGEEIAFDGNRAATGFLPRGGRSELSAFLNQQDPPLKEGLFGGALSTAWALLRVDERQPRLEYRGLKKVDGRELHELSYRPRKGGADLKIVIHLDAAFRHVRTKYSYQIGATIGTRESADLNPERYYSLTEDFDDFRVVDGLTLPHQYRVQVSTQTGTRTSLYDYLMTVSRLAHNEPVSEELFTLK